MANELMLKAHTYGKVNALVTKEWFVSEKLDGRYALWDGGITRGLTTSEVPWAKDNDRTICTGLWSSHGKVVNCPDWFLRDFPSYMLDGELYCGRGEFQKCMSITRKNEPIDAEWRDITFMVFGCPRKEWFMRPRIIEYDRNSDYIVLTKADVSEWLPKLKDIGGDWEYQYNYLIKYLTISDQIDICLNTRLGTCYSGSIKNRIDAITDEIVSGGGEGIMLRAPWNIWTPGRSKDLLKYKPYSDAEGTVVGWTEGEGKYEGMLGALILSTAGGRLKLSGFTDAERELDAYGCPKHFMTGDIVTYKYRELSDDGIPKEARYYRKRS